MTGFYHIDVDTHRKDDHALDFMAKEHVHGEAWTYRTHTGQLRLVVPDHLAIIAKAKRIIDQWAV